MTVSSPPPDKKFNAGRLLPLVFPGLAIAIIASRLARLTMHPAPLDVLAILASIALAAVAAYEAIRGRHKRAVGLFALELAVGLFVVWQVDIPWATSTAPAIERMALGGATAGIDDARGDHDLAAWERVVARGGGDVVRFISAPPHRIIEQHECDALERTVADYIIHEPALLPSFSHVRAACAAARGDQTDAITYYREASHVGGTMKESDAFAGALASSDGNAPVAVTLLRDGLNGDDHDRVCKWITYAYSHAPSLATHPLAPRRNDLYSTILNAGMPRCAT